VRCGPARKRDKKAEPFILDIDIDEVAKTAYCESGEFCFRRAVKVIPCMHGGHRYHDSKTLFFPISSQQQKFQAAQLPR
jgi:hypothetical protein